MKMLHLLAIGFTFATATAGAHHSFAAEYDGEKPVTLSGVVARLEWTNPHIHFYLDVKDANGAVAQWKVEGYPPNMLVRQGWKKDVTLKPGDAITVFAWRARVEPNQAHGRQITFADGTKLAVGPPAGIGGQ